MWGIDTCMSCVDLPLYTRVVLASKIYRSHPLTGCFGLIVVLICSYYKPSRPKSNTRIPQDSVPRVALCSLIAR